MMTFDYGGDGEPMGNAQLGRHHHPRVETKTETKEALLFQRATTFRPDMISARTEVACVCG